MGTALQADPTTMTPAASTPPAAPKPAPTSALPGALPLAPATAGGAGVAGAPTASSTVAPAAPSQAVPSAPAVPAVPVGPATTTDPLAFAPPVSSPTGMTGTNGLPASTLPTPTPAPAAPPATYGPTGAVTSGSPTTAGTGAGVWSGTQTPYQQFQNGGTAGETIAQYLAGPDLRGSAVQELQMAPQQYAYQQSFPGVDFNKLPSGTTFQQLKAAGVITTQQLISAFGGDASTYVDGAPILQSTVGSTTDYSPGQAVPTNLDAPWDPNNPPRTATTAATSSAASSATPTPNATAGIPGLANDTMPANGLPTSTLSAASVGAALGGTPAPTTSAVNGTSQPQHITSPGGATDLGGYVPPAPPSATSGSPLAPPGSATDTNGALPPNPPSATLAPPPATTTGVNGLPSSALGVTLTPTTPSNALTNSTISAGPTANRVQDAIDEWQQFAQAGQPQYDASLRSAQAAAFGAGRGVSGMERTSEGDLANVRANALDTERSTLLNQALDGSISDAYQNVGIAQQQQGEQQSEQAQAFGQQVTAQQLSDAENNQAFQQAYQQALIGYTGDPTQLYLTLAAIYGAQSTGASTAATGLATATGNANASANGLPIPKV